MFSSVSLELGFEYINEVTEILDMPSPLPDYSGTFPFFWWKNKYKTSLPPRGYVWIVHGLGEHMQRYDEVALFLTQLGFDVLGIDFPGHGLSRERGHREIRNIDDMITCLNSAVDWWFREGPEAKQGAAKKDWFLLGHSMGAITSLAWMLEAKQKGLKSDFAKAAVISAPPLELRLPVPAWKAELAKKIHGVKPYLEIGNEISISDLSYESANLAAYRGDPLVHGNASPDLFLSIQKYSEEVLNRAADFEIPVALIVGEDDPIVLPDAVERLYHAMGTHKKFLKMPNSKHEVLNEVGKETSYRFVAEWFL